MRVRRRWFLLCRRWFLFICDHVHQVLERLHQVLDGYVEALPAHAQPTESIKSPGRGLAPASPTSRSNQHQPASDEYPARSSTPTYASEVCWSVLTCKCSCSCVRVYVCTCVRVYACVRGVYARACVSTCVRACVGVCCAEDCRAVGLYGLAQQSCSFLTIIMVSKRINNTIVELFPDTTPSSPRTSLLAATRSSRSRPRRAAAFSTA